jgi:hypothetical protein
MNIGQVDQIDQVKQVIKSDMHFQRPDDLMT